MNELNEETYSKIEALSDQGNAFAEKGSYDDAIKKFMEAFELVPAPKTDWNASTWLLVSIGDMYFLKGQFSSASKYFFDSLNCSGSEANPFIYLRLGQCLYEMNEYERAKEYLLRAYMLEGNEIFEAEDKKYFEAIKDIV